jgi:integrase
MARPSGVRPKGNIEERGGALRVRVYAGVDPVTGKQSYLRATIPGTDDAAWRKAENKLTEFRAQVLRQRNAATSVPFRQAVAEWLQNSEVEDSTGAATSTTSSATSTRFSAR